MPEDESFEKIWKSQEEESMEFTTTEIRAAVRKYERESVILYWAVLSLIPVFFGVFAMSAVRARQPLLIMASGLAVATFCCMVWPVLRAGPRRAAPTEPGLPFLWRLYEGKIRGLRWVRWCMLLIIPAAAAAWFGGSPVLQAHPALLIVLAAALAFVWFALWREGRRFQRELDKLG